MPRPRCVKKEGVPVNPVFMTILLFLSMSMFIGTLADRYWLMRAG